MVLAVYRPKSRRDVYGQPHQVYGSDRSRPYGNNRYSQELSDRVNGHSSYAPYSSNYQGSNPYGMALENLLQKDQYGLRNASSRDIQERLEKMGRTPSDLRAILEGYGKDNYDKKPYDKYQVGRRPQKVGNPVKDNYQQISQASKKAAPKPDIGPTLKNAIDAKYDHKKDTDMQELMSEVQKEINHHIDSEGQTKKSVDRMDALEANEEYKRNKKKRRFEDYAPAPQRIYNMFSFNFLQNVPNNHPFWSDGQNFNEAKQIVAMYPGSPQTAYANGKGYGRKGVTGYGTGNGYGTSAGKGYGSSAGTSSGGSGGGGSSGGSGSGSGGGGGGSGGGGG